MNILKHLGSLIRLHLSHLERMAQNELYAFLNYGVRLIQLTTELTMTLVYVIDTHDHGKVIAVGLELREGRIQLGLIVESWYIGTGLFLIET